MLSILFYIIFIAIAIVLYLVSWVALIVCYPFDKRRVVVHTISKWITCAFFELPPVFGRDTIGVEHVDRKQPYVIVLNHNSMADIMSIYHIPLIFKWVSKREVYKIPLIGRLLFMHGDIVINRSNPKEAMQFVHDQGMKWLKRGASVSIFPEGTRSKDGEIHRFKAGAFALAKEAGVAILPVVMDGSSTMFKPSMMVNWRNEFVVKVLPAISAEDVARADQNELMEQVREKMVDTLAEIRRA